MDDKLPHYELDITIAGVKVIESNVDELDMICPELVKVDTDYQHNNWSSKWCEIRIKNGSYCSRRCTIEEVLRLKRKLIN